MTRCLFILLVLVIVVGCQPAPAAPTPNVSATVAASVNATIAASQTQSESGSAAGIVNPTATLSLVPSPTPVPGLQFEVTGIKLFGPGRSPHWTQGGDQIAALDNTGNLLFYAAADGSQVGRLRTEEMDGIILGGLAITPDGNTIGVWLLGLLDPKDTILHIITRQPYIRASLNVTDHNRTASSLAISPEGTTIALFLNYRSTRNKGELQIMPTDGTKSPATIATPGFIDQIRFSKDGRFLYYIERVDGVDGKTIIVRIGSNGLGKEELKIEYPNPQIRGFALSPDEDYIALAYSNKIWIQQLDGGSSQVLTIPVEDIRNLGWSPQGDALVFATANGVVYLATIESSGN